MTLYLEKLTISYGQWQSDTSISQKQRLDKYIAEILLKVGV